LPFTDEGRLQCLKKKEIRLAFDPSDLQIAEEAARRSEVDFQSLPQSQFIDGFSAVLIAGGALLIAKFVLDLIERFRGGIVIDLRSNGKGSIKRDKAVPAGWAVVLTEDGQVESASTTLRRMHPRGFSKQSSVVLSRARQT
jgi:hypothetical protein